MCGGPPPSAHDAEAIAALQEALRAARFDAPHVAEALGAEGPGLTPSPAQVPALLRSLPAGEPLSTLVALLVAAVPVPAGDAAAALAPLTLEAAEAMHLLTLARDAIAGEVVRPCLRLVPAGPILVACDLLPDPVRPPADVVIGVSATSWALANLTVRRPVESALDLGTGCGIQALLAARHASRILATDTNARALGFARFSAALNGVANVELAEGDLFEPVGERTFDLVVANPPFVISPDGDYQYRDGGRQRDELSRQVLGGVAPLLNRGGLAHALVSWVHEPDGDWSQPLREWLDGLADLDCDALLLHFESRDAEEYAVAWNQPLAQEPELHATAIGRWLDYFAQEGIRAIGYGAVVLRRRGGTDAGRGGPWVRAAEVGRPPEGPAGDQVWRMFTSADFVDRAGPEGLLRHPLTVEEDHRVEQVMRLRDGAYEVEQALLHLEGALPLVTEVDGFAAELLARLDGTRPLADAIDEAADACVPDADRQDLREWTVELVRWMVEMGFVHP